MKNQKKLIIIKISGASLKGEKDIIDINFLNEIARQIKEISQEYKIAVVLGGGNIWRGNIASKIGMERYKADQMGMLATVMNSLALQSALTNIDVKANIFSTIEMEKIADSYIIRKLMDSLDRDEIAILSCGTGRPYFTTDTGIAVSAAELHASYILMGKNNVDGVYDSDPNINPNAKFFEHLTYSKAINDDLKVMDATAAAICKQTNIRTIVFRINEPNGIVDALNLKNRFTLISEDPNDISDLNFLKSHHINEKESKKDFSDDEIEKFLEEETPIFAKMSDEDIEAVENFLKQVEEHAKEITTENIPNQKEKSLNPDLNSNEQNSKSDEKDFASEFFSWEKNDTNTCNEEPINKDVNLFETEENFENLEVKNDIDVLNDIENKWNEINKTVNESKTFGSDESNINHESLFDELQKGTIEDNISLENKELKNDNISQQNDKNNFLKDMDFYIKEIEKIKKDLIEGNKTKIKEIRENIERKK